MPRSLSLQVLHAEMTIVRLPANAGLPWWAARSEELLAFTRTKDETSIVCESRVVPEGEKAERGYRALKVEGPLAFTETGILASIAAPLAHANVPIFVISTFDTDLVLIPGGRLAEALDALRTAGHHLR